MVLVLHQLFETFTDRAQIISCIVTKKKKKILKVKSGSKNYLNCKFNLKYESRQIYI